MSSYNGRDSSLNVCLSTSVLMTTSIHFTRQLDVYVQLVQFLQQQHLPKSNPYLCSSCEYSPAFSVECRVWPSPSSPHHLHTAPLYCSLSRSNIVSIGAPVTSGTARALHSRMLMLSPRRKAIPVIPRTVASNKLVYDIGIRAPTPVCDNYSLLDTSDLDCTIINHAWGYFIALPVQYEQTFFQAFSTSAWKDGKLEGVEVRSLFHDIPNYSFVPQTEKLVVRIGRTGKQCSVRPARRFEA